MVKRPQCIGPLVSIMVWGVTSPFSSASATVNGLKAEPSS